jgi:hypothetical protein
MGCSFFSGTVENKVALELVMLSEEKATKAFSKSGHYGPQILLQCLTVLHATLRRPLIGLISPLELFTTPHFTTVEIPTQSKRLSSRSLPWPSQTWTAGSS